MPIPEYALQYWPLILQLASEYHHDPYIILAIGDRETSWGTNPCCKPKGPACLGDKGHGHGLMQIDDRSFPEFCASEDWKDPEKNIRMGCRVLRAKRGYLRIKGVPEEIVQRAAVAAYNCGEGNVMRALSGDLDLDIFTANHNYSRDVLSRAHSFRSLESGAKP